MTDTHGTPTRGTTFNLGDLFDTVARALPDRVAIVHGDTRVSYGQLRQRTDGLAAALRRRGIGRGDRLGLLMHNTPGHLIALLAAFKTGVIPFNLNYRYERDELGQILDDAEPTAVIHTDRYGPTLRDLRRSVPGMRLLIPDDTERESATQTTNSRRDHAPEALSTLYTEPPGREDITSGRCGDDVLILYTGGTTGLPKGVEWSHKALFFAALGGGATYGGAPVAAPVAAPDEMADRAAAVPPASLLTLAPLMHGAGMWTALIALLNGACLVLSASRSLDGEAVWDLIEKEAVVSLSITGNSMAAPLIAAWDAHPERWHASSLAAVSWGGAPMSEHYRNALRTRLPAIRLLSGMGSTESGASATVDLAAASDGLLSIAPKPDLAVLTEDGRFARPGELGILARTGPLPNGYWRDPKRTADTFITVEDRRWVLTGDYASVGEDGRITFYGRGSTCINTGGEKVYPEEVENVLRAHPAIHDVVVVGAPDERWGEAVTAVAVLQPGRRLGLDDLRAFCDGRLARYKLPARLVLTDAVKRSPAGKADVRWARAIAVEQQPRAEEKDPHSA
ncbi:AMP-binding protein [Streptomyces sp. NPDC002896]|uniref:AMP-binding protein n=1 Tax=Streptomyces sp. NPDC002896 TaxID=3154438 RepID=UPI00331DC34F